MNYIKKLIKGDGTFRCPIPMKVLKQLGIDPIKSKLKLVLDGNQIIITKYEEENVSNRRAVNE